MTSVNRLVCGSCSGQRRQPLQHRAAGRRQPEDGRQLRDQDVHGNAGEKARR